MKVQVKESDLISLIENIIKEQEETTVCVTAKPAAGKGKGKWLGITKMKDREALGNVKVGSEVTVDNGIPTTISKIWHDANKRPGAFQFEDKNIALGGTSDEKFWDTYQGGTFNREDWRLNTDGVAERNVNGKWKLMSAHDKVSTDSGLDNIYNALKAQGGNRQLCFGVTGSEDSGFVNKTSNYKAVTHSLEDVKSGKATIGVGDKGDVVKEIQKMVGAKPDGYFGPNTLTKVKEYQKSNNFTVTGKIDGQTLGGGGVDKDKATATAEKIINATEKDPKGEAEAAIDNWLGRKIDWNKIEQHAKINNVKEIWRTVNPSAGWIDTPKFQQKVIKALSDRGVSPAIAGMAIWPEATLIQLMAENKKSFNDIIFEVLDEKELAEEELEGTEGGGVSTGTSDAGGKGAKTWESGVTRGSGNPAGGVTHWADSYSINRGKGNPLTESKWYNTVGDIVGIVDPTGVIDGINAMSYFKQGDIFYGMLSLISLIPYAGDLVAKPIVAAMKLGKFGGKGINAAAKSGNATKLAGSLGKTKMGRAFMGTFKNKKTQGWLASLFAKIGKIPGFGRLAKDGQTYTKLFTKAANISKAGGAVRIFRTSGGLLTKMQRRGLLGRTKLYSKFAAWMLGLGVGEEAMAAMNEGDMDEKFKEWASSEEGQEEIMDLPEEEKTDFIAVLKEMMGEMGKTEVTT
tara:strand:+ start:3369 stop:5423 length:2055 start_codon:yes stop_codon:yes gene_type:complete